MERRARERQEFVLSSDPQVQLTYLDAQSGARGYLVIDTLAPAAAYGGVRIAKPLRWTALAPLARIGTVRYQLARINMSGAKCGLEYDPKAPDRLQVLERFLRALAPYLERNLSLGPDLGVTSAELDQLYARMGLPSRMAAVQRVQEWDESAWPRYLTAMDVKVGGEQITDLQVPYFAAHALKASVGMLLPRVEQPRVVVMGLGPFGMRLARLIAQQGCRVIGLANNEIGWYAEGGLSDEIMARAGGDLLLDPSWDVELITYHEALRLDYDVLVLADGVQRLTTGDVGKVGGKLVVEAAQRAVTPKAELVLLDRGIQVLPNFAVSIGAIVLADALRSGEVAAEAEAIFEHLAGRARTTTIEICRLSLGTRISLREAGLRVAFRRWERLPATWTPSPRRLLKTDSPP
jgi:glutamate dehydrogenase (NAD(P)+)